MLNTVELEHNNMLTAIVDMFTDSPICDNKEQEQTAC
jgi:hypothetical protein